MKKLWNTQSRFWQLTLHLDAVGIGQTMMQGWQVFILTKCFDQIDHGILVIIGLRLCYKLLLII